MNSSIDLLIERAKEELSITYKFTISVSSIGRKKTPFLFATVIFLSFNIILLLTARFRYFSECIIRMYNN